jgi:hypothetical protein
MRKLFSVVGQDRRGRAVALIIAENEAEAEDYAINELDFVTVSQTMLTSDSVHIRPANSIE